MITFFRKIRRNLLESGKASRYLAYALGEIALVVIGILIALQINNWNEERKSKARVDKLLLAIQEDLQNDLFFWIQDVYFYKRRDSLIDKIVNKKAYGPEDYRKLDYLKTLLFVTRNTTINDENYQNLMGIVNEIPESYGDLMQELHHLYREIYPEYQRINNHVNEMSDGYMKKYSESFPWMFFRDEQDLEAAITYFTESPLYLNDLSRYRLEACFRKLSLSKHNTHDALVYLMNIRTLSNDTTKMPRHIPQNYPGFKEDAKELEGVYTDSRSPEQEFFLVHDGNFLSGFLGEGFILRDNRNNVLMQAPEKDVLILYPEIDTVEVQRDESGMIKNLRVKSYNAFDFKRIRPVTEEQKAKMGL